MRAYHVVILPWLLGRRREMSVWRARVRDDSMGVVTVGVGWGGYVSKILWEGDVGCCGVWYGVYRNYDEMR